MTQDIKDIVDSSGFSAQRHVPAQTIKVIGVGGGGCNAVTHMFKEGIKDVSFVVINTDRQVLDNSPIPTRLVIGPGRGAGGDVERAARFAEDSAHQIAEIFDDHTDMVFITAGMGGGTGTGAAPVVARIAKEKGILTVGIVTIPFIFEGRKKVLKAIEGAREVGKNVDALLMINNERLTQIYKGLSIFNAFAKADDTLLNAAKGITEIITNTGVINRDFNDVDTTLRDGGTAIIASGYGEGENRVTAAIEDALHSPLLRDTDIETSRKLLMVLYVSDDEENNPFSMEETEQLTDFINNVNPNVDVMWGLYRMPELGNKVKITILASGFDVTVDEMSIAAADLSGDERSQARVIQNTYGAAARKITSPKATIIDPSQLNNDAVISGMDAPALNRGRMGTVRRKPFVAPAPAKTPKTEPEPQKPAAPAAKDANTPDDGGITRTISFDDL